MTTTWRRAAVACVLVLAALAALATAAEQAEQKPVKKASITDEDIPEELQWLRLLDNHPDREELIEQALAAHVRALEENSVPVNCSAVADASDIQVFDSETFHAAVRQCPFLVVLFHHRSEEKNPLYAHVEGELAKVNRHLKKVAANNTLVKQGMQEMNVTGLAFGVVSLDDDMYLARSLGITGTTILVYKQRAFRPYWGERTAKYLARFAGAQAQSKCYIPVETIEERSALRKYPDMKVVAFVTPDSEDDLQYDMAARAHCGVIPFFMITSQRVAKGFPTLNLSPSNIRVVKPQEKVLSPAIGFGALGSWVKSNEDCILNHVRPENLYMTLKRLSNNPTLYAFIRPKSSLGKYVMHAMREVAAHFHAKLADRKPRVSFAYMDMDEFPDFTAKLSAQFGFYLHERDGEIGFVDFNVVPAGVRWFPIDEEHPTVDVLREWVLEETRGNKIKYSFVDVEAGWHKAKLEAEKLKAPTAKAKSKKEAAAAAAAAAAKTATNDTKAAADGDDKGDAPAATESTTTTTTTTETASTTKTETGSTTETTATTEATTTTTTTTTAPTVVTIITKTEDATVVWVDPSSTTPTTTTTTTETPAPSSEDGAEEDSAAAEPADVHEEL